MLNVSHIVASGGLILLGAFLYAEVGLFLGFFLPGDTLVIAAGVYAAHGKLSIAGVLIVSAVAAIAGDNTAFWIGRHLGPRVFRKDDGLIFRKDHIQKAEEFYERFGAKLLLVSHFLPVVRTFTPLLAGVGNMPYRRFVAFNMVGDSLWAVTVGLLGYYVGSKIPNIDHYILLALGAVIVLSLGPTLLHFVRLRLRRRSSES